MKKIGIVGAGLMGSGIAQKAAQEGLEVVMVDVKPEFVEKGLNIIKTTLQEAVDRKILTAENFTEIMGRIHGTTNMADVKDCDIVIEAVPEDMKIKHNVFKQLDAVCEPKTIIASNTSTFRVDALAEPINRKDRFLALHYFYHPAKNRLLEIIPGSRTSKETINASKRYSVLTGKTDILVKDAPGFAVNRFFVPVNNESTRMLEEGVANSATIEKAGRDALGIAMGPFEIVNLTGVPMALHASAGLAVGLTPFYEPSKKLKDQAASGKLWPIEGEIQEDKLEAIKDRFRAVVFYIISAMLDEGVSSIDDIDLGAKVGLRWAKGPFELMNDYGIAKAYDIVEKFIKRWPDLKMPQSLIEQKKSGKPWEFRFVKYYNDGEIGRVVISRPDAMNALNHAVVRQLDEAFKEAEADKKTKAIILETTGKAFVAGADIKFFIDCIKEDKIQANYDFTLNGQEVFFRIDESKKLVIAKMDGLALGGGFELALSCDVIIATNKAVMGFPETGIGIYPGLGGTQRPTRFIGKELAKYLVFTGRVISADEAKSIGLIEEVFTPDEIDGKIESLIKSGKLAPKKGKKTEDLPAEWQKIKALFADENIPGLLSGKFLDSSDPLTAKTAKTLAGKAPIALKLANEIMDKGSQMSLRDGLKQEMDHLFEIFKTKDALTGLTSVGKKPQFEGK
ncbi:MAG: enoyl-CoA hydratase/isomerase family protein [Deltaproteobacteria bacterium]|nr:enoyl-CoA hydratase/isomerase family protein [Deltaproteobacteria bacterium]